MRPLSSVRRYAVLATYSLLYALLWMMTFPQVLRAQAEDGDTSEKLERNINFENWEMISGAILPFIMPVIIQSHWTSRLKAVVTAIALFGVAFVGQWLKTGIDLTDDVFGSLLKIGIVTIPTYYGFVKPTGYADGVGRATDLSKPT